LDFHAVCCILVSTLILCSSQLQNRLSCHSVWPSRIIARQTKQLVSIRIDWFCIGSQADRQMQALVLAFVVGTLFCSLALEGSLRGAPSAPAHWPWLCMCMGSLGNAFLHVI
jgi:hypothetical protein